MNITNYKEFLHYLKTNDEIKYYNKKFNCNLFRLFKNYHMVELATYINSNKDIFQILFYNNPSYTEKIIDINKHLGKKIWHILANIKEVLYGIHDTGAPCCIFVPVAYKFVQNNIIKLDNMYDYYRKAFNTKFKIEKSIKKIQYYIPKLLLSINDCNSCSIKSIFKTNTINDIINLIFINSQIEYYNDHVSNETLQNTYIVPYEIYCTANVLNKGIIKKCIRILGKYLEEKSYPYDEIKELLNLIFIRKILVFLFKKYHKATVFNIRLSTDKNNYYYLLFNSCHQLIWSNNDLINNVLIKYFNNYKPIIFTLKKIICLSIKNNNINISNYYPNALLIK